MKYFFLVILSLLTLLSSAQDITLTRNGKTKTIEAGTFIELGLPAAAQEPCDACPSHIMAGQLVSYANGVVKLKVKTSEQPIVMERKRIGSQTKVYTSGDDAPVMEIPKDIILSITKKGNKKLREGTTLRTIGAVLTVLGVGHLTAAGIVEIDEGDGGTLLGLGLGEFVAGVALAGVSKQKTYVTSTQYPGNQDSEKIWKLN